MVTLMFHSVGLAAHPWRSNYVAESFDVFRMQIQALCHSGRESLFMAEACRRRDDRKAVYLNFDDGYLDNWVHVLPMLKKYGIKATVFITPEFVDPRDIVRPQHSAEEGDDKEHRADDCCAGFLSWPEMREMEKSGVMEIQAHALTHTWYFKGARIVDFWHPGAATESGGPVWMLWNRFPELKPFYLTRAKEYESQIPYGTPIYEHGKSLETHRFFPNDTDLAAALTAAAAGPGFFDRADWRETLRAVARSRPAISGRTESHEEYLERVRCELASAKNVLEEHLDKTIDGLCWPGGGVTPEVVQIAQELGYRYFTMPSKWKYSAESRLAENLLPRIGAPSRLACRARSYGALTPQTFNMRLNAEDGGIVDKLRFRLLQFWKILAACNI